MLRLQPSLGLLTNLVLTALFSEPDARSDVNNLVAPRRVALLLAHSMPTTRVLHPTTRPTLTTVPRTVYPARVSVDTRYPLRAILLTTTRLLDLTTSVVPAQD